MKLKLKTKQKHKPRKKSGGIQQRAKRAKAEKEASEVQSGVASWAVPYFGKIYRLKSRVFNVKSSLKVWSLNLVF